MNERKIVAPGSLFDDEGDFMDLSRYSPSTSYSNPSEYQTSQPLFDDEGDFMDASRSI
jgi:hypothetical protein